MSDYPAVATVETATQLLKALGEAKRDFGALDTAVAQHLRGSREPAIAAAQAWRRQAAVRHSVGIGSLCSGEFLISFAAGGGFAAIPYMVPVHAALVGGLAVLPLVGAAAAAKGGWNIGTSYVQKVEATEDTRRLEFLRAGVRVEVSLDSLARVIEDAQRGSVSAEAVAERVTEARQAFDQYLSTVNDLDESDATVAFPWASRDFDVMLARELVSVDVDAVLAHVDYAVHGDGIAGSLPTAPVKAVTTNPSGGGLAVLTAAAQNLRAQLVVATAVLDSAETAALSVARSLDGDSQGAAVEQVVRTVREALLRATVVESDCHSLETAATAAPEAADATAALAIIDAAPEPNAILRNFEAYTISVQAAVDALVGAAHHRQLREAGIAVWHLWSERPKARASAQTLATVAHAERRHLELVATS